jgi:hypothetical protein
MILGPLKVRRRCDAARCIWFIKRMPQPEGVTHFMDKDIGAIGSIG